MGSIDPATSTVGDFQVRLAGTMTGIPSAFPEHARSQVLVPASADPYPFWDFSQSGDGPLLRRLPQVEERVAAEHAGPEFVSDAPLVSLLPPQPALLAGPVVAVGPIAAAEQEETQPDRFESSGSHWTSQANLEPSLSQPRRPEGSDQPSWKNLSDADAALFTGVCTDAKTHEFALAKIQRGYMLADRHAYYAARQEFIQVLRMVSSALGAKEGTTERTTDLASGIRALEEAEDFVPRGTELEADLNVSIIVSAHRTPVAQDLQMRELLPRQFMDRYFRYAQLKLAAAVQGDPDGSMALHALGKLQRRLGQLEPADHPLAHRQAFAFQQASLLAHPFNHLAAHELGVLLADAGRHAEAERLLKQVAMKEPHPVVLRNLAQVQYKLGRAGRAAENDRKASALAAQPGVVGRRVRWVSPTEFAHAADATSFDLPAQSLASSQSLARPPQATGALANTAPEMTGRAEASQSLPGSETIRKSAIPMDLQRGQPQQDQPRKGQQSPGQISRAPGSNSHPSRLQGVR